MAKGKKAPSAADIFGAPPSKSKGIGSDRTVFTNFINKHKALKPFANLIWTWAPNYGGITAPQLAAAIWRATKGNPTAQNIAALVGTKGGINANNVPLLVNGQQVAAVTPAEKQDPAFLIQYLAWAYSGAAEVYGTDQGYNKLFGPTAGASPVSSLLPAGYLGAPKQTANQSATGSVTQSEVTASQKNPWVVLTPQGQFREVNSVNPPKNVLTYGVGAQPVRASDFNAAWKQTYADTFEAYTGRHATPFEIAKILAQAPSPIELANELANKPGFTKSPTWKAKAPGIIAVAQRILGNSYTPPTKLVQQAIAQNWDQSTFEQHLRQLPAYQNGPEFKTNLAQNTKGFEDVFGDDSTTDPTVQKMLREKTLAGWTPDQVELWARQQPAYKQSPEYQTKWVQFMQQLGLITGQPATLSGDQVNQMLQSAHNVAAASNLATGNSYMPGPPGPAPQQISEHGQGMGG